MTLSLALAGVIKANELTEKSDASRIFMVFLRCRAVVASEFSPMVRPCAGCSFDAPVENEGSDQSRSS
jgi:hypothetical protein